MICIYIHFALQKRQSSNWTKCVGSLESEIVLRLFVLNYRCVQTELEQCYLEQDQSWCNQDFTSSNSSSWMVQPPATSCIFGNWAGPEHTSTNCTCSKVIYGQPDSNSKHTNIHNQYKWNTTIPVTYRKALSRHRSSKTNDERNPRITENQN